MAESGAPSVAVCSAPAQERRSARSPVAGVVIGFGRAGDARLDSALNLPYKRRSRSAQVAQLVEQRTENPCVGGSIPPLGTTDASGSCVIVRSASAAAGGVAQVSLSQKTGRVPRDGRDGA